MKDKKRLRGVGLLLLAIGMFLVGATVIFYLAAAQQGSLQSADILLPPATLDQPAPKLSLTDLEGQPASFEAYRGQVVLVNNWATWCPPCKTEMPELEAYYQAHRADGFTVIAIESGEPAATVADFVRQNELTFPVWLDPKGAAVAAFLNWDLPSSYVIDRDGVLRLSWTGPVNRGTLEKYVTPLLEK